MPFADADAAFAFLGGQRKKRGSGGVDVLRAALAAEPSLEAWLAIVGAIESFPRSADEALCVVAGAALRNWPEDFRQLPAAWWSRYKKKKSALATLARVHYLTWSGAWTGGELYLTEGAVSIWAGPGKDVYVHGSSVEPNRAGGDVELLSSIGAVTSTLRHGSSYYGEVRAAVFSADSARVITACTDSAALLLTAHDCRSGKTLWEQPLDAIAFDQQVLLCADPATRWIAVHDANKPAIVLLDGETGARSAALAFEPSVAALGVHPSGRLVVADAAGTVHDVHADGSVARFTAPSGSRPLLVRFDATGAELTLVLAQGARSFAYESGSLRELPDRALSWELPAGFEPNSATLHPELGVVLFGLLGADRTLTSLVTQTQELKTFAGDVAWVNASPDGREWLLIERIPTADHAAFREALDADRPGKTRTKKPKDDDAHDDSDDDLDADDDDEFGDAEFYDERRGGIYLYCPDGHWQIPTGRVESTVSAMERIVGNHPTLTELVAGWGGADAVAWAIDTGKWGVNDPGETGLREVEYPLHKASQLAFRAAEDNRIFPIIDVLLARGADPTLHCTDNRATALHALFYDSAWGHGELGCPDKVQDLALRLMRAGCDPWAELPDELFGFYLYNGPASAPALFLAKHGFLRCIAELTELRGGMVQTAAVMGRWETVDWLLERGLGIDARGHDSNTALHWIAAQPDPALVHELIQRGADPRATIGDKEPELQGFTALHLASKQGRDKVAAALLDAGAELEARTPRGWTALHMAAEWGELATAQLLVARRADTTARTADGETPLDLATPERLPLYPREGVPIDDERRAVADWLRKRAG
jgi:hypothetical protein